MMLWFGIDFNNSISSFVNRFPKVVFKPNLAFKARLPSTMINSGVWFNFKMHSCIPFIEAFRMLISSISFGCKWVTANVMACCSIIGLSFSLVFSDNCLLSFKISFLKSGGRMMAAAVTGPARQPRPASSVPVSIIKLEKLESNMLLVLEQQILQKNIQKCGSFFYFPKHSHK